MSLRLFVALEIPPDRRVGLAEAVAPLRSRLPGAHWSDPAGWHVTLRFLGAVTEERLAGVTSVVAAAAAGGRPGETWFTGLGAFPSPGRARVLWAGLADPAGVLAGLMASLEAALSAAGFPPEARAWTPHLTLARFREPARVGPAMALAGPVDPSTFPVREVVLFRSHLGRAGARYEALGRFTLAGVAQPL